MRPEGVSCKYKSPLRRGVLLVDAGTLYPFKSKEFNGEAGVVALSDIDLTVMNVAKNAKWERKKRRKSHGLYCLPISS